MGPDKKQMSSQAKTNFSLQSMHGSQMVYGNIEREPDLEIRIYVLFFNISVAVDPKFIHMLNLFKSNREHAI